MNEKVDRKVEKTDAIKAAFENAAHSLALEGLYLDKEKFPEIDAVLEGI